MRDVAASVPSRFGSSQSAFVGLFPKLRRLVIRGTVAELPFVSLPPQLEEIVFRQLVERPQLFPSPTSGETPSLLRLLDVASDRLHLSWHDEPNFTNELGKLISTLPELRELNCSGHNLNILLPSLSSCLTVQS